MTTSNKKFSPGMGISLVVANMIGTGVFTSLCFQLLDIQSGFTLMMLWVVGGLTALCGALTYAELAAALPRSGGEYNFLSQIYHPAAGFISGLISLTMGFAAPSALAAITFGNYLKAAVPSVNATLAACLLVVLLTWVHCTNRRFSGDFQQGFTLVKIAVIILFCLAALFLVEQPQTVDFTPVSTDYLLTIGPAFAISLIYVNYAYTGWNAATYITNELESPQRSLPMILAGGTALVMLLYLALNFTFLMVAPMSAMAGKIEIGYIAADYAFGKNGARLMGLVLAILLISTVSAMILAGPRVLQVIGQDYSTFKWLATTNHRDIPTRAIVAQSLLCIAFVLSATFESILVFSGFVLGLNTLLVVVGIFVLRWRQPDLPRPYRTWLYPLPPLIFLGLTCWTLVYILMERPQEGLLGIALIVSGGILYKLANRQSPAP